MASVWGKKVAMTIGQYDRNLNCKKVLIKMFKMFSM
jgi:hypothetical protein